MMQGLLRRVPHGARGERTRHALEDYNAGMHEPELLAELGPVGLSQYYAWRRKARKEGPGGLTTKKGRPRGSRIIPENQADYILGLKAQKPHRKAARVVDYLKMRFGAAAVSASTVYRFLNSWQKEQAQLYQWMRDPDRWKGCFLCAFGNAAQRAEYYLHAVEFDTTPADIRCADGLRYKVIGGIDIFARKPWVLVSKHSTSAAVAALWRRIITAAGVFDVAVMDNGKEYRSHHIEAASQSLGIDLPEVPHFAPEKKPHIERFFKTMSVGLFEELEGYAGHNVAEAQALRNQKSFAERFMTAGEVVDLNLSAEELQQKINRWIQLIYCQRRHNQLGMSPEEKAAKSPRPVRVVSNERALDILLAPGGRATVQKKGVRVNNGIYAAAELIGAIRKKVDVRLDLVDASRIYVFAAEECEKWDPRTGEWGECRPGDFICLARDSSLEGLSVEELREARKAQLSRMRAQAEAMKTLAEGAGDPMGELLEQKARQPGRVVAFHRKIEAQAPEAFDEAAGADLETGRWREGATEEIGRGEDTGELMFEWGFERYRYLIKKDELSAAEQEWIAWYRETDEFYEIFGDVAEDFS